METQHTDKGHNDHACHGPGYASPLAAMQAEREKVLYTVAFHDGTGVEAPGYLATIDVDPASPTYSQVIHRTVMPNLGDELHHFGWNACSSCHGDQHKARRFLIVPGFRSSRIYILDTEDPRAPHLHKVIEPAEVKAKTNLHAPHTVHCLADGQVMISMLGDADGNAPGGFLLLDGDIMPAAGKRVRRHAVQLRLLVSAPSQRHGLQRVGAPQPYVPGFNLDDVDAGQYGRRLHFWDWQAQRIAQTVDLGEDGLIPLEVRFHHNPDSTHGFVGAALSSTMWHWHKRNGKWTVEKSLGIPGRSRRLAVSRAGTDYRSAALAGRPLSLSLQLAAWRHSAVRHERPGTSEAGRPGLVRRRAWQRRSRPGQEPGRWPADAPAQPGRQTPLCDQFPLQQLGQPVLSRPPNTDRTSCRSTATRSTAVCR